MPVLAKDTGRVVSAILAATGSNEKGSAMKKTGIVAVFAIAAVLQGCATTPQQQREVGCVGAGVAGAPKFGDAAAWGPRIAQGADTLHTHALQGFQGKAGFMPPKGGRTDLSDQSVINAVDYIVASSQ